MIKQTFFGIPEEKLTRGHILRGALHVGEHIVRLFFKLIKVLLTPFTLASIFMRSLTGQAKKYASQLVHRVASLKVPEPIAKKWSALSDVLLRTYVGKKLNTMIGIVAEYIHALKEVGKETIYKAPSGSLSFYTIARIAIRNLFYNRSRSVVSVIGMAFGIAAVVFLVSFGYGLQNIVTQRLVQPLSLRMADIQSDSTALALTAETLKDISKLSSVEDTAGAISLAGAVNYNNSRMDVVILGVDNKFLEYSYAQLFGGTLFSRKAEEPYAADCKDASCNNQIDDLLTLIDSEGEVAGASDEASISVGAYISEKPMRFRVPDNEYVPLRLDPKVDSPVVGYVKGTILRSFEGKMVWGGSYTGITTSGRAFQSDSGTWFGRWIEATLPIYEETAPTVYRAVTDETGNQRKLRGFLVEDRLQILTQDEIETERTLNYLLRDLEATASGSVLGEATVSASTAEAKVAYTFDTEATESATLEDLLKNETQKQKLESTVELGVVEVQKTGGKEVLVSTAFLNALKLDKKDILGKSVSLEYIIGGGAIKGVSGRIISKPQEYRVVGVIENDSQSILYAPIADVYSLGVQKLTTAKVLATTSESLTEVREKIEVMGYVTQSIVDTLTQVQRLFSIMRFLLGAFGMIALIVAIFGMFNTLTVSLLERTRELSVMKTLGTTDRDIMRLFLAESFFIGAAGGVVGILFGVVIGQGINLIYRFYNPDAYISLFSTPLSFVVLIFLFSLAIGLGTGIYPSYRTKTISPLDALRYE